jgi:hypothetical protein
MRRTGRPFVASAFAIALAAAVTAPTHAQNATDLQEVCKALGEAKLGEWASFDAVNPQGGGGRIRLAVVGSERAGDTTLYWFEMNFVGADPTHSGTVQILNPSLAAGMAAPHALVFKWSGQPAMKVSGAMGGFMGQRAGENTSAFNLAAQCPAAHVVGWESVTVPAGTFRALHVRTDDGAEVWSSRDVPFGLVKTHGKRVDMALTGHGTGAKSSISETPMEMPGFMTKP